MLDDQQVVRAAPGQVIGVGTLGVQGVRGHDGALDLDAVQQRGEHRDLVGLRAHLGLAQDHAVGLIESGQQVAVALAAVGGAA